MPSTNSKFLIGLDYWAVPDIKESVNYAGETGYDYCCLPLVHPRFKREFINEYERVGSFTRPEFVMDGKDWSTLVIGKLSSYINVDSPNECIRKNSEQTLQQEISWAIYMGISSLMIDLPHSDEISNFSRIINGNVNGPANRARFWIKVPLVSPIHLSSYHTDEDEDQYPKSLWAVWSRLSLLCDSSSLVGVALEMTDDLPEEDEINRWIGEPVKCIIVNTRSFITNKRGYPVLSRPHQAFLKAFINRVSVILTGVNRHEQLQSYAQYIRHLYQSTVGNDTMSLFTRGYEDFLQTPLQPLMDNLEAQTYEVFESDPVKYKKYYEATRAAICDKRPQNQDTELVVMVVGAGRGPIVRSALQAADEENVKIRMYAVEKNPNAVVSLQMQKDEVWKDRVTIVQHDMRTWDAPEKADIILSELLGSFGDNELSPECLDGAQRLLKDDGVCVPQYYCSYLAPIQSHKLYTDTCTNRQFDKPVEYCFEQFYVAHQISVFPVAPIESVFTFTHPNKDIKKDNSHNIRQKYIKFKVSSDCVLHGFAGYFEATLYGNVKISIVPETHTEGMFSWFPIYIPIYKPFRLNEGDTLEVGIWRLVSPKQIWYEWAVMGPHSLPIHNTCGRSYFIGLD